MPAKTNRSEETRVLAQTVALVAAGKTQPDFAPTIRDVDLADAFDAAMACVGNKTRAFRGHVAPRISKSVA